MNQPDLFSSASEAKHDALRRVGAHADPVWLFRAEQIVRFLARAYPEFTSDDVWARLDREGVQVPHEPRALGAVMHSLAKQGVIRKTGEYRPSKRTSLHASPRAVWERAA